MAAAKSVTAGGIMRCLVVSHFHWDREWYRTFQAYRARLLDAVDCVLELVDRDPECHFLLDGQVILLEDYVALRPQRRSALERGIRAGRLDIGPWYVQPDALLPSGEAHVRNLLYGRAAGEAFGPVSRVAYVPDSFGHPAQMPQLFAGFGLGPFVYWRGDGDAYDEHGGRYRWSAPDGSEVTALLLRDGYFNAAFLPPDLERAASGLAAIAERLAAAGDDPVVLMNGFDHMYPDAHVGDVVAALRVRTGWDVQRAGLEPLRTMVPAPRAGFRGALDGGRLSNLLPGVWSARLPIKLANRRCEALLEGWLEPWTATGLALGGPDERPALDLAWRTLLECQAHDSIGGCAIDRVAAQVETRLAEAGDLAEQTVARLLARCAGLAPERAVPLQVEQTIAVFNPSPHARTDVVRIPLEDYPALRLPLGEPALGPLTLAVLSGSGFAIDGAAARLVPSDDPTRARWVPGAPPLDLEFVARDVPGLGCRRVRLTPCAATPDQIDDGRAIEAGDVAVRALGDGTLAVRIGTREWTGLCAVEDRGDRGDTYDFDPVDEDPGAMLAAMRTTRRRHASGLAALVVRRVFDVPAALDPARRRRQGAYASVVVEIEVRVAPGVPRVDLDVRIENGAEDHRLRLLFPTGAPASECAAASTFDVARRGTRIVEHASWVHPAPATFPHQGWVHANDLTVAAPGLPEAEVSANGTIAITLLRAVGWLARFDLTSRPLPAGPEMPVPAAQLPGRLAARLSLSGGLDPGAARAAELGLRATIAGDAPLLSGGQSLLSLQPSTLLLSALKPATRDAGIVLRVLNPTDTATEAVVVLGVPIATATPVRLDEEPDDWPLARQGRALRFAVPPRALRSVRLATTSGPGPQCRP